MSDNTSGVTPVTREEQYLSYIAGESSTKPDKPVTRMEKLLNAIAEGGSTFYVDLIPDPDTVFSTDVTYGEMQEALNSGKTVVARIFVEGSEGARDGYSYMPLTNLIGIEDGRYYPEMIGFLAYAGQGNIAQIVLDARGNPTADTKYSVTISES